MGDGYHCNITLLPLRATTTKLYSPSNSMFGIRWTILHSMVVVLLEQRVHAFLVPRSSTPIHCEPRFRHPTTSPKILEFPSTQTLPRNHALLDPATEGAKGSLDKVWTVLSPLLLPLRAAVSPLLVLLTSNEWQINLIKHVLTLVSIRFVASTIMDYKRQTCFQWRNVPRYLLAAGLVGVGGIWIDSIFVIPYYGINLIKHAILMWGVGKSISIVNSRRKTSEDTRQVVEKSVVAKVVVTPAPKPEVPSLSIELKESVDIKIQDETREEEEKNESNKNIEEAALVVEEQNKQETPVVDVDDEKADENKSEKEALFEESLKDWVYSLANIQDELAELQLKRIPGIFSTETYERTQERITKFQMRKLQQFFAEDDDTP